MQACSPLTADLVYGDSLSSVSVPCGSLHGIWGRGGVDVLLDGWAAEEARREACFDEAP